MTKESKQLKYACLAALFLGLIEIVLGFVLKPAFGSSIFIVFTPILAGILLLILGIHGARAANIPSKAAQLRIFATIVTLLSLIPLAYCFYLEQRFTVFLLLCVLALICDLSIMLLSVRVKKALDRA